MYIKYLPLYLENKQYGLVCSLENDNSYCFYLVNALGIVCEFAVPKSNDNALFNMIQQKNNKRINVNSYKHSINHYSKYSAHDDELILNHSLSNREIAKRIGRTKASVGARRYRLLGKEVR